jgi:acid phosphatase type 7
MEAVDRSVTPWVLVTIHVPIYNTFSLHKHDLQIVAAQQHLEPLLVKYVVNVVFSGHIHAYQRTANVAMGELTSTSPIHITIGAGGRKCDALFKSEEPEEWIVQRDATFYGYGRFDIFNQTHAQWRWIPLSVSDAHSYNVVAGEADVHLPKLKHDELIIENQYYLDN